jgi:hypothetical protein
MVKPDIIRKGSKVFFYDTREEPVTVYDNINGEIIVELDKMINTHSEELYPVPLNAEIICRCGFFKTDQYLFEHPKENIELEIDHNGITHMHIRSHGKVIQLNALHELQHAFWLYTNQELSFK